MADIFSGHLPAVPVYKNGMIVYCHNKKELDKWTKPEDEGGPGYTQQYTHQEYPKLMSHPSHTKPDIKVNNAKEQKAAEKQGYNFEHFDNNISSARQADASAAAPSFDPKAQAEIDGLKQQLAEQTKKLDALMEKLGA